MMRDSLQPFSDRVRRVSREIAAAIALTVAAAVALVMAAQEDTRVASSIEAPSATEDSSQN